VGKRAVAGLAGPGHAVTDIGSPDMTKRSGATVHPVVPAHLACRIGARARTGERNAWSAVAAIALGTFALVFSELIPVGLLADISGHLRVSVGTGGLMVVVPAVAAAVAAPLLTLCSARLERRTVLVALSALVLVSDVIGGLAPDIGVMLAARAMLLAAVTGARPLTIALVAVWGLGFGAVPVAAQSWMARAMPANVEGGLALFVSALQGALAGGSAVGGIVYDADGPGGALIVAAVVAALAALTLLGRAGAAISSPPAAIGGTADNALRTR
jgi:predicted MFS family arabinose efflux permease